MASSDTQDQNVARAGQSARADEETGHRQRALQRDQDESPADKVKHFGQGTYMKRAAQPEELSPA